MNALPMEKTARQTLPDLARAVACAAQDGSYSFGVPGVTSLLVQPSDTDSGVLVRSRELKGTPHEAITIYEYQTPEEILTNFRLFLLRSKRARNTSGR